MEKLKTANRCSISLFEHSAFRLVSRNILGHSNQAMQDDVFGFESSFIDNNPLNQFDVLGLNKNDMHCCPQFMRDWSAYNACYNDACRQLQECERDVINICNKLFDTPVEMGVCITAGLSACRIPFGVRVAGCPGFVCSWPGASKKSGC